MHLSGSSVQSLWPTLREPRGRLLGLPFVLAAGAPGLVFEWQICLAAVTLTILSIFVVFVPLTALALNRGQPMRNDIEVPPLTRRAYIILFLLWTATAWLFGAALQMRA